METIVKLDQADLCVETFGDAGDPAILLIGGMAASMDWWDEEFCGQVASAGRYVIRYDHRDTGRSTSYPVGKPGYTGMDLAGDAVGVLDALGIRAAHVVGLSMGGGLAQVVVVRYPERVASLTLIATSPYGPSEVELPPPAERIRASFGTPAKVDWHDRAAVIEYFVEAEKLYGGSIPLDEARIRAIAGRVFDRTVDMAASQTNHMVIDGGGGTVSERLAEISVPVLVMHGTEDPLFPYPHGEALAAMIPGAVLVPLEKMGHQYPPPELWPVVVPELVRISG